MLFPFFFSCFSVALISLVNEEGNLSFLLCVCGSRTNSTVIRFLCLCYERELSGTRNAPHGLLVFIFLPTVLPSGSVCSGSYFLKNLSFHLCVSQSVIVVISVFSWSYISVLSWQHVGFIFCCIAVICVVVVLLSCCTCFCTDVYSVLQAL